MARLLCFTDQIWILINRHLKKFPIKLTTLGAPGVIAHFPMLVPAEACADKCRSTAECHSFVVSRDGQEQCALLISGIAVSQADTQFDSLWDTYVTFLLFNRSISS